jgi:hypothetical protein
MIAVLGVQPLIQAMRAARAPLRDNLNRWGNLPRFLALQHGTLKIAFSHGLGGKRAYRSRLWKDWSWG